MNVKSAISDYNIKRISSCLMLLMLSLSSLNAQAIDILLKNGHVFDAKNKLDTIMDVAIKDGKILQIAPVIVGTKAKKVIDLTGLYVVPGLIDPHTHVFVGPKPNTFANGINSLSPDDFSFKSGVTTMVDAGTSGWKNFSQFKTQVIDVSKTRVLAFLNIAANGMTGDDRQLDINEMEVSKTVEMVLKNPQIIVGIKIGHFEGKDWTPFNRALEAGTTTNRPLFVECHLPQYSLADQLIKMRPGDIITHAFENISERTPVVDASDKVLPYVFAAKEKGIHFDVGHGGAGFWFNQAIPALEHGLWPDSFGTDLHRFSMNAGMKDMLNLMSKYLNMGMPLRAVLKRGSYLPAKMIKREDLGHLGPGSVADIAVLSLKEGNFGFIDAANNRIEGNQKLEAELTIRAGKIVWDLNGLSASLFENN